MTVTKERSIDVVTRPVDQKLARSLLSSVEGQVDHLAISEPNLGSIPVPDELTQILETVLNVVANGGTVTIGALPEELTTTVAARMIGVSRPTLMKMIDRGEIPAHMVNAHHRLKTSDVHAFQKLRIQQQKEAFAELRVLEEDLENFTSGG